MYVDNLFLWKCGKISPLKKYFFINSIATIAQLGERQTEDLKVPGSIPGGGIFVEIPTVFCFFGNHSFQKILSVIIKVRSIHHYIITKIGSLHTWKCNGFIFYLRMVL